jgi:hypothetical protein
VWIIACIEEPKVIEKILTHLEAKAAVPGVAPGTAVRLSRIIQRCPQDCDASGAATVAARLMVSARW